MKKVYIFALVIVGMVVFSAGCMAPPQPPQATHTSEYSGTGVTYTTQYETPIHTHSTVYSTSVITSYVPISIPTYFNTYVAVITYTDPIIGNTSIQSLTAYVDKSRATYTLYRWFYDGGETRMLKGYFEPYDNKIMEYWTFYNGSSSSSIFKKPMVPFTVIIKPKTILNIDPLIVSIEVPNGLYFNNTDSRSSVVGTMTVFNDSVAYIDFTITVWSNGYAYDAPGHAEITFYDARWSMTLSPVKSTIIKTIVR